ncbi:FANCD2 [Lepeophtheirus salmonis]|uniref:FANCD2 n=2 Tax=Lepeophtheirus salmonis TaxID=72036 RepID=A0A7R8HAS6_LEPSM|nr:FANCD2 [Lepeophtheirus salmonis]CAF2961173.1 FANCD2 [Lepeophtheirus salmonis]
MDPVPTCLSIKSKKRPSDSSFQEGIASKKTRASCPFSSTGVEEAGVEEPLFRKMLSDAGLILNDKGFHTLNLDQAAFLKKFSDDLETSDDSDKVIKETHDFFQSSDTNLEKSLQPSETDPLCTDARGSYQDSLIYLLLTLEPFQKDLFSWLLEKLAELSLDDLKKNQPLIRLILNHLKYLNMFQDSKELTDKYLEILDVVPSKLQLEMIASLPEVIDYKHHEIVGRALKDLFSQSPELISVILDSLTNLTLDEDVIEDLRHSISKTVSSTEAQNLPVVIKFLLCTSGDSDYLETILTLREQLDLSPPPVRLSQSRAPFTEIQVSTLGVIRSSIMRNKKIGDAWIKAIDTIKIPKEHQPLDFIVIILLMDLPNRQKSASALFKSKIRSGLFTEELFIKAITDFPETIKKDLHIILELIDPLIASRESPLNHAAEVIYTQIFIKMQKFCRQEIVAELTTKVSSNTTSRSVSIDILSNIAYNHTDILSDYSIFLSGIMDYMDTMSLDQVRRIMDILSLLAYHKPSEQSIIRDDVHIVVTKQLSSVNPLIKRMGVIGAVVTIKNMSRFQSNVEEQPDLNTTSSSIASTLDAGSRPSLPSAILRQAKDLLINVRVMTNKVGEFAGLFMDELASVMQTGNVDRRLGKWIKETVANDFQECFIKDVVPDLKPDDEFLDYSLQWGLEDIEDSSSGSDDPPFQIALNLSPMVSRSYNINGETPKLEVTKAARFIPHFRLLKTCVFVRNKGDLSEIDALLGCSTWFIETNVIRKIETLSQMERNVVCSSLFYAINWYREILNAFAPAEDSDYNTKVVSVLQIIIRLRHRLKLCLPYNPEFIPPPVLHSIDVSKWKPPIFSSTQVKKAKGRGKGKKKAKLSESQISHSSTKTVASGTQIASSSPNLNYDLEVSYAPFFRELDLDAFHILGYDTLLIDVPKEEDDYNDEEDLKSSKIRGPELLFLLKDIFNKLDHVLIAKANPFKGFPGAIVNELKNAGFSNLDVMPKKMIAIFGVKIIEYVLANLEVIQEYYVRLIKMNDEDIGNEDTLYDANTPNLMLCLEYGLKILDKLFNWNGFGSRTNRILLKEGLSKLASRVHGELNAQSSLNDLVEATVTYICKFGETTFCSVGFGAALIKFLETLKNLDDSDEESTYVNGKTGELCENFLKKEWKDPSGKLDKTSLYKKNVEYILTQFLSNQETTELLEKYIDELEVVVESGKSSLYCTFTTATLQFHFRALFVSLIYYAQTITYGVRKNHEEQLDAWSALIMLLYKLVMVVKVTPSRVLISVVAKQSRVFLNHFIKNGMPMIDKIFKSSKLDVVSILKSLQRVTRFLQHVCSHSKLQNDLNLSNYVPLLKKTLETFVYRVKVTLAYNDCLDAFLMGNLKNRNLQGAEIPNEESDEEEEEETTDRSDEEDDTESSNTEELRQSLSIEV